GLSAAQVEEDAGLLAGIQAVDEDFLAVFNGEHRPVARLDSDVDEADAVARRALQTFVGGDCDVLQADVAERAIGKADHADGGLRVLAVDVAQADVAKDWRFAVGRDERRVLSGKLNRIAWDFAHGDVLDEDIFNDTTAPARGFDADAGA